MRPHRGLWVIATSVGALALLANGCASPVAVPGHHDLGWRSSGRFTVVADLGSVLVTHQPVDILLLFDQTASMDNVIGTAKTNASGILRGIRQRYPNSAFGVAALSDYQRGESPWTLYQDLTLDLAAAAAGLRAIQLTNGVDLPEAYSRGLHESRFVGWRTGARRYLVLFGDAPAHDPSFYGVDFGVDPGRDGVVGTADDLRFADVVEALATDSIVGIAVYDGSKKKRFVAETRRGFDHLAARTGGVSLPIKGAREVVDIVQLGLSKILEPTPRLAVPSSYAEWVRADSFARVKDSTNGFAAPVGLQPPPGVCNGIFRFPLTVVRAGNHAADTVGQVWVTVRLGALNLPWRGPLLVLFVVPLVLWFLRRLARGPSALIRYEQNHRQWRLLGRAASLVTLSACCVAIWRYAPGNVPPPSDESNPANVPHAWWGRTRLPLLGNASDAACADPRGLGAGVSAFAEPRR